MNSSQVLTPEKLIDLPKVGILVTSPSGEKAIFSQSVYSLQEKKSTLTLHIIDLITSEVRPLTSTFKYGTPYEPVFLDDKNIIFLQARDDDDFAHIYVVGVDDEAEEAYQLSNFPIEVGALKYNSTLGLLGFAAEVYEDGRMETVKARDESIESTKTDSGMVYNSLNVRSWNTYLPPKGKKNNVFVVKLDCDGKKYAISGSPVNLLLNTDMNAPHPMYGDADDYDFSPDGKQMAFICKSDSSDYAWKTTQQVFITSTSGGSMPQCINSDINAYSYCPKYAPDGTLAYLQMMQPGYDSDKARVILYDGKARKNITEDWPFSAMSLAFSSDSQSIYVTADDQAHLKIFAINRRTEEISTLTHEHTATLVSTSRNGIIFRLASMNFPHLICNLDLSTMEMQTFTRTPVLQSAFSGTELPKPQAFWFEGARGDKVHGWLLKPANHVEGKKYPVAFLVHGGPQMPFRDNWVLDWHPQIFTSAGYAVVGINRHGSTGFGSDFCDCLQENWGSYPYIDLEKGLAHALAHNDYLDAQNVFGLGFSFGGYLINWLNGQTKQFKAFVNHGGMFSLQSTYYGTDELAFPEREFGGPPFDERAQSTYEKWSPSSHVRNWKTPTLVTHGGRDYRIPETEGIATFTALQRQGVPSRFLFFPDEPHRYAK
ncbi:Alpha/Beta hydrolase protein [Umbelopsis sp. AD052]|nr:Alpha/Beta hydrolase protein [Umbelopsis sp. AD052]